MNTPNFPENCMKSKEFGRPGGGVRPSRPPLDPPMTIQTLISSIFVNPYVHPGVSKIKGFFLWAEIYLGTPITAIIRY